MVKIIACVVWGVMVSAPLLAFQQLPATYQVSFGDESASTHITEYISLSCPKCVELFQKEFMWVKERYITTHHVQWTFHPHPADLLTLQLMVCLEKLNSQEKKIFWEVVVTNLSGVSDGSLVLQTAMEVLGKPIPQLADVEYLKKTEAFSSAYRYLKQRDIVQELPTVEIDGVLYDAFPSRRFLDKKLSPLCVRSS